MLCAVFCLATMPGRAQTLLLDFNSSGQYTGNFNNPNTASPCTETNSGGVTNSGALLVTGGDGNATYNAASWDFSTNTASVNVSLMVEIQQATGTGNKIQLGLVSDNTAGFANASGIFGSFRLLPQSTTSPTYQLAAQERDGSAINNANVGSPITLTAGHWYQFNTCFTNTGPGTSYYMACSLMDYGTDGATPGANAITFDTLQTVTGSYAALASDNSVWPGFRVANDTGAGVLDNVSVMGGGGGGGLTNPPVILVQPASQTVSVSNNVTFSVTANNATGYQWYTNSAADSNGTGTSYTLNNVPLADNGMTVQVVVTNSYGSTNSSVAVLTVTQNANPSSVAGLPIYTDNLVNGFQDWSYGTHNLANTSPVHSGNDSISVTTTAGHNLSFYQNDFNTSPYASVSFWADGGSGGGQILQVQVNLGGVGQRTVNLSALPANAWEQFTIPLSTLGGANATNFDRVTISLTSSGTTNTFYVDDIQLDGAPVPALVHLNVNAAQIIRAVDARMFGVNTATWDGNLNKPQTVSLLNEMGCTTLRYPGGSTADTYHWSASDFNKFASVATNVGAQALVTVNYGTGTSNEAASWVRFSNVTNQYGFKYWEIGNEIYGSWEADANTNAPYNAHDPWTYATLAANYIQQMKAADPTIKVGVVMVSGDTAYSNGYTNHPAYNPRTGQNNYGWTPVMLTTLKGLGVTPDFAIYHYYFESSSASNVNCQDSDPLLLQSTSVWAKDAATMRQEINDYFGASGSNIELLVTENNSDSGRQGKQSVSLVNTLYYADSLARLMQTEFNAFVWWDLRNSTDTEGSIDPTLYGWRLYGDLGMISGLTNRYPQFYAAKLMQYFARSGDLVLSASSDYLLLPAYAARHADGAVTLLVINKDVGAAFNAAIELNGFTPGSTATVQSYGIPQDAAAQTGAGSPDIAATNFPSAGTNFNYTFPPLSLTLFTFPPSSPRLAVLSPAPQSGGQLVLQLQGQPGDYVIQTSTNLSGAWSNVSTNTFTGGALNFTNAVPLNSAQQFWRLVWKP